MSIHECDQRDVIATMKEQLKTLFSNQTRDEAWKMRIEDKIDKILWFFLGQTFTILVGVATFFVTRR